MPGGLANWGMVTLVLTAWVPNVTGAAGDKGHAVGKAGLTLGGKVDAADAKVKVILFPGKSEEIPAKLFLIKLRGGTKYRISMASKEVDSVLVIHDKAGSQLAWDDDSGGDLNSLVKLDVVKDTTYKVYAGSFKGSGNFTLR